jgi:hypothetical protein
VTMTRLSARQRNFKLAVNGSAFGIAGCKASLYSVSRKERATGRKSFVLTATICVAPAVSVI